MFDNISNTIKEGSLFYGLELRGPATEPEYLLVLVRRKGDEIDLVSKNTFNGLEEACKSIPKVSPLFLILNTDQVVSKEKIWDSGKGGAKINELFPAINTDDFYWELLNTETGICAAICRKEIIQGMMATLKQHKVFVPAWGLGGLSIEYLPEELQLSYKNNGFEEGLLHFGDIGMERKYLPAFSAAYSLAGNSRPSITNYDGDQAENRAAYRGHRFFKLGLGTAVALVLVSLLVNFLFFNYYFNEVSTLQGQTQVNGNQKKTLVKLSQEVGRKEKMVNDVIRSSSSRASFYMDWIASGVPKNILLQSLTYQPVTKRIKTDSPILFKEDRITVLGDYNDNLALSTWIAELENLGFVEQVTIANLEKDKGDTSKFELDVSLKSPKL